MLVMYGTGRIAGHIVIGLTKKDVEQQCLPPIDLAALALAIGHPAPRRVQVIVGDDDADVMAKVEQHTRVRPSPITDLGNVALWPSAN